MKSKILMYHSIGAVIHEYEEGAEAYSVSEENFYSQMQMVALAERKAPGNIILTFDDGFLNNYHIALPVLKEFELKAYFFIVVNRIGSLGYMNWDKIKEMHSSGMVIGSHGMTHEFLTEKNEKELDYEIKESKRILEEGLKASINYFSVPRGFYNKKVIAKAKEAGYKAVFTSNIDGKDNFRFGRIAVKSDWTLKYFTNVLNKGFSIKYRTKSLITDASKKLLGRKKYDSLRSAILFRK